MITMNIPAVFVRVLSYENLGYFMWGHDVRLDLSSCQYIPKYQHKVTVLPPIHQTKLH